MLPNLSLPIPLHTNITVGSTAVLNLAVNRGSNLLLSVFIPKYLNKWLSVFLCDFFFNEPFKLLNSPINNLIRIKRTFI